jgi:N-acyl-L-homoserine lactone synthetase
MITVIEPHNAAEFPKLMEEMFKLRARVFRDRLGWNVQVADGKERDKYDDEAPVYVIYADDEAREVKGCLRLLPTTGPTVLTDFFFGYASRRRASQCTIGLGVHPVLSRRPDIGQGQSGGVVLCFRGFDCRPGRRRYQGRH